MITFNQIKDICHGGNSNDIIRFIKPLNDSFDSFEINTPLRKQHFLAQTIHESGCFHWLKELASGKEYEGRKDLGNAVAGDGVKFKGRGLIQITGRVNYALCSDFLFGDNRLLQNPEILELPEFATKSAMWFWHTKRLNLIADHDEIKLITKLINGGYNGLDQRAKYLERAKIYITN